MASPILRGDDNPQRQKQTYTNDWSRGSTYGETWKGINPSKMIAKYNGIIYTADSISMSISQGVAEMEVKWAGAPGGGGVGDPATIQVTTDRWEIPEPRVEKEIYSHPEFLSSIASNVAGLSDSQISDIVSLTRQYAEQAKSSASSRSSEKVFRDALDDYLTSQSFPSPPVALYASSFLNFYRLCANGQDHYQSSQYACRHTTNAPSYWSLNRADLYCNSIYSPAQFMSEVTDGSLWYFPMPGRLQFKLAAAVSALSAITPVRSNFLIGWLKGASAEATVARGRLEIQTQYVLDQWSTDVYRMI